MKKSILSVFFLFVLSGFIFCEENLFSFSFGLSSGSVFYDSVEMLNQTKGIREYDDYKRLLLGASTSINYNPIKEASFYIGAESFFDIYWTDQYNANYISLDFPFGIKIYPNIGGLNLGLAYLFGIRFDNVDFEEYYYSESTAWGNGFKINIEYNFAHDLDFSILPAIGCYWKCIPRGRGNYDNQIGAYVALCF